MKKIFFDKAFLIGLGLYMRQIALSIDRSIGGEWAGFLAYFHDRASPMEAVRQLRARSPLEFDAETEEKPKKGRAYFLAEVFGIRTNFLHQDELYFTATILEQFCKLLLNKEKPPLENLVELRLRAKYAEDILVQRLRRSLDNRHVYVDHFNQNPILQTKSINQILGSSWPPTSRVN